MGMKRKRLVYVKKFGKKFAGWLSWAKPAPAPAPEPAPAPQPEPVAVEPEPVVEEKE